MATTDMGGSKRQSDRLPAAVIEDLLAEPRRRALLECLDHHDGPVSVDDLAVEIASKNGQDEPVSDSERRAIRTEIYQDHLPKLLATGVITLDSVLGHVGLVAVPALTARLHVERSDGRDGTKDK